MEFFVVTRGSALSMNELHASLSGVFAAGGTVTVTPVAGAFSFITGTPKPDAPVLTADPISGQPIAPIITP